MFSGDFLFPAMDSSARPSSRVSQISNSSAVSNASQFQPIRGRFVILNKSKDALRDALVAWRERRWERRGSCVFIPPEVGLPPKQTNKLVSNAAGFM